MSTDLWVPAPLASVQAGGERPEPVRVRRAVADDAVQPFRFGPLRALPSGPGTAAGAAADADDDEFAPKPVRAALFPVLQNDDLTEQFERARVQGHAAGYAAGRREATATLEADRRAQRAEHDAALAEESEDFRVAFAALRAASEQLTRATLAKIEITDGVLLRAAVDIAGAILGRELDDREGSAVAAVRRALGAAGEAPVRAIRLHPEDLALVARSAGAASDVQLVPDATLRRGDAVADLVDGIVDARIATALDRIRAAMTEMDAT